MLCHFRCSFAIPAFALHIWAAGTSAQTTVITGLTVELNGVAYHLPPQPVGRLVGWESNATATNELDIRPITVISSDIDRLTAERLRDLSTDFSRSDDVFQDAFLEGVFLQDVQHRKSQLCNRALDVCKNVRLSSPTHKNSTLPAGPYFVSSKGSIFQAWRLYPDTQGAFSQAATSHDGSHFTALSSSGNGQYGFVATPSRLYYTPTDAKPLSGIRIGVKDIYDVKGLRTSVGNRAWYELYPPANETAPAVQNLLDAGAILIGKMKTSQFANGETATADWIDYHAPFNPRGDGYQDGSSSSTGPAAGVASYPWLDISLGSDTGGSIRSPSQLQGVYGNRPTHGLVSMQGAMPLAPQLDTAGIFARDPRLWAAAAKALYKDNMTLGTAYPSSILTVGFPNDNATKFNTLLNTFLLNLTSCLSGAHVKAYDVEKAWEMDKPGAQSLSSMMNQTYELLTAKEQIRLVRDRFYSDYAIQHDGRRPYVNPSPLQRWQFGDDDAKTIDEVVAVKTEFMDWFNEKGLPRDEKTCSKHLLLYARIPKPIYRDTYVAGPSRPFPFSTTRLSVYGGAPDVVLPIGEVPYISRITNKTEPLPVTVDVMAARGCDGMIFSLVKDMHAAGRLPTVKPGRSLMSGSNFLL